jgi:hypothetical protein
VAIAGTGVVVAGRGVVVSVSVVAVCRTVAGGASVIAADDAQPAKISSMSTWLHVILILRTRLFRDRLFMFMVSRIHVV